MKVGVFQGRRNDNINTICVLEGVGEGQLYGKLSQNAVFFFFLGNSMTIKFGNFANFIVRNVAVIWEAPSFPANRFAKNQFANKSSRSALRIAGPSENTLRPSSRGIIIRICPLWAPLLYVGPKVERQGLLRGRSARSVLKSLGVLFW